MQTNSNQDNTFKELIYATLIKSTYEKYSVFSFPIISSKYALIKSIK